MHLKQMRACGNACDARSRIARFGHVHHIRDVNTVASQYRSALVRVLMCAPKVVPCVGHFCGAWLIGFKPRGKTSRYRVTALLVAGELLSPQQCTFNASTKAVSFIAPAP